MGFPRGLRMSWEYLRNVEKQNFIKIDVPFYITSKIFKSDLCVRKMLKKRIMKM